MPEKKWKSPLLDWEENNQDPNLAFTLVARNEGAKQMWADPHNNSRYVPSSFTREAQRDRAFRATTPVLGSPGNNDDRPTRKKKDTEPALRFLFNNWPKSFSKGFVLGSDHKPCDALLGDPGSYISQQTLAFTFNKHHQLIMNVTSDNPTWVRFNNQKKARRTHFSWILLRDQKLISVNVADVVEFDVVVPRYGINKDDFHKNCESFLSAAAFEDPVADGLSIKRTTATTQSSGTSSPPEPFYLRGKLLGSGSYGSVHKALRMPDGKIFAAKAFKYTDSFRQEADMLKKVCGTPHINITQFVEEWHGDHNPLLIMEYVAGGTLLQRLRVDMEFGEVAHLAHQTLAAVFFLHDQGVMHRDIKPANILCVTPDHYKLADFGVSKDVAPFLSKEGTAEYMAPEIHDQKPYSYPADIWSLGVVLIQCLDGLPDGRPGSNGRRFCEEIFSRFTLYYWRSNELPGMNGSDAYMLILLVKNAMLRMDPKDRLSARKCLEDYRGLWEDDDSGEVSDAGSGANTPTQVHPDASFPPASLCNSKVGEVGGGTSLTDRSNGDGSHRKGRGVRIFRNEDKATVIVHGKGGTLLPNSVSSHDSSVDGGKIYEPNVPSPPAVGAGTMYDGRVIRSPSPSGGTPYDPCHEFPSVPYTSETETHTGFSSDGSVKRPRDSHVSAEDGENDGSVKAGRRVLYHPSIEVATPGPDSFAENHSSKRKRSRSSVSGLAESAAQGRLIKRSQSGNSAGHPGREP